MVLPVEKDARGIVAPEVGLRRFRLERHPPSPDIARFVDRYWIVTWDLPNGDSHTQHVLSHPVVNLVFAAEGATINGVTTRLTARTLTGAGRALGVMFRPAGFRPFLGRPMSTITDKTLRLSEVFRSGTEDLARTLASEEDPRQGIAAVERFLRAALPSDAQASEDTSRIVERVARDPAVLRVDRLAEETGMGVRRLQRRFSDHVGIGAKAVIRRYRLYEAAERARHGDVVNWAALATELGYSDQAHLTRDFTTSFGMPPHRYARACRGGEA